jgi:hypothetical protein
MGIEKVTQLQKFTYSDMVVGADRVPLDTGLSVFGKITSESNIKSMQKIHADSDITTLSNVSAAANVYADNVYADNVSAHEVIATTFSEISSSSTIINNEVTLDLSRGCVFQIVMTDNINAFKLINIPSSVITFMILVRQNNTSPKNLNWSFVGNILNWSNNSAPSMTASLGKLNIYSFMSLNGNVWYGTNVGENYN